MGTTPALLPALQLPWASLCSHLGLISSAVTQPLLPWGFGGALSVSTACLGWHCCASCRAGDAVLGLTCLAVLAGLRAMKSHLPQAAPAEPLAVRISHLIVWISATGMSAVPCPSPSRGLISVGQGRHSLKLVKPRLAGAESWRWLREDKAPRVLPLCPFLRLGMLSSSDTHVLLSLLLPWAPGSFHSCSLHSHSSQCSRCPVCWPGRLLLPGFGLAALQAHGQHPPGPAGVAAAAFLPGSAQRHRPLPEHGAGGCWQLPRGCSAPSCVCWAPAPLTDPSLPGPGGRPGRGAAHGAAGDHRHRQGFR